MNQEPTIDEMNKTIAKFMGYYYHGDKFYSNTVYPGHKMWFKKAKYHTSWDWLMPVVQKITSLDDGKYNFNFSSIGQWACYINRDDTFDCEITSFGGFEPLILNVYKAVHKFIQWYNKSNECDK